MDTVPTISVGDGRCDIKGFTNEHLQSAVDHLAAQGGGIVAVSAGIFAMADALHLRSGVTVRGQGATTVLRKRAMTEARIITLIGYGHHDLIVDVPDRFRVGDGVIVGSDATGGFLDTAGTLVRRDGDTWFLDRATNCDYSEQDAACVRTLHPLVDAIAVEHAVIEDVMLDGRAAENAALNSCRGGAFYAYCARRVTARRVTAQDFNGDGFSFQHCDDLELDACRAESCRGNGYHPGSGSNRFHIHHCVARGCDTGLFYCLRVRDSVLEDCRFEHNRGHGVLIWARDDRHLNRRLTIRHNGGCGVCFMHNPPRQESNGHTFEDCRLEENCATGAGPAEIILQGGGRDTRLIGNRILRRPGIPGILVAPGMPAFENRDNTIEPPGPDAVVVQA